MRHGVATIYGWVPYYPENIKLGRFVDIGWGTFLQARYGIEIGDHVEVGPNCAILSENSEDMTHCKIIIKRNVMIGANCVILPRKDGKPLVIGRNARIKAGTIVTKSIPDNFHYP